MVKNKASIESALRQGKIVFAECKIDGKLYSELVVRNVRKQTHEVQVLILEGWKFPKRVYLDGEQ